MAPASPQLDTRSLAALSVVKMPPYDIHSFFTLPDAPNRNGFCYNDLFNWDDDTLELKHNYIQWYFPLAVASECNGDAPVLSFHELNALRKDEMVRVRQRMALNRMLKFFSIKRSFLNGLELQMNPRPEWIHLNPSKTDHNYLRITRIMSSLVLLNNRNLANKLLHCLLAAHNRKAEGLFPHRTIQFWKEAVAIDPEKTLNELRMVA